MQQLRNRGSRELRFEKLRQVPPLESQPAPRRYSSTTAPRDGSYLWGHYVKHLFAFQQQQQQQQVDDGGGASSSGSDLNKNVDGTTCTDPTPCSISTLRTLSSEEVLQQVIVMQRASRASPQLLHEFEAQSLPSCQVLDQPGIEFPELDFLRNEITKEVQSHAYFPSRFLMPVLRPDMFTRDETVAEYHQLARLWHQRQQQQQSGAQASHSSSNPARVMYIRIVDTELDERQIVELPHQISIHREVEVLVLRNIGLTSLDGINLPNLRFLDVSHNNLSNLESCMSMLRRSPALEVLLIHNNVVTLLPSFYDRIIVECRRIMAIDRRNIDADWLNEAYTRFGGATLHEQEEERKFLALRLWDVAFCNLPQVLAMIEWNPELITEVTINHGRLTVFHVSVLPNLRSLDLAHNQLASIAGCGLERCMQLEHVNLSHNLLANPTELSLFFFVSSLRTVWLVGNPRLLNYRSALIYYTRYHKGTKRSPGIQQIDGIPVTIEERVAAVAERVAGNHSEINKTRWRLCVYEALQGAVSPSALNTIKYLSLPNCHLYFVNLFSLQQLEFLDLSGNPLREVYGVQRAEKLQYLNLSGCVNLQLDDTLKRLSRLRRLVKVSFCLIDLHREYNELQGSACLGTVVRLHTLPPRHPLNPTYRAAVLDALAGLNRNFMEIDNLPITPAERIESYARRASSQRDVERYKFHLFVSLECCNAESLTSLQPEEVAIGKAPFVPSEVLGLYQLAGKGLISDAIDLRPFSHLQELDLSHNELTDVSTIGLHSLPLRALDLSHNHITNSFEQLVDLIGSMGELLILALHDNPIMPGRDERFALLQQLYAKYSNHNLKILDHLITEKERVSILATSEQIELSDMEKTMTALALKHRLPSSVHKSQVVDIDLRGCGLKRFDVTGFVALRQLLMSENFVSTPSAIVGTNTTTNLQVLDLRSNLLNNIEEVARFVRPLSSLISLGLANNPFNENDWRQRLFNGLVELFKPTYQLRAVDGVEISIDELVHAWSANNATAEPPPNLQYQLRLQRNIVANLDWRSSSSKPNLTITEEVVTELDFTSCNLPSIQLSKFTALRKLSLAYNRITSQQIHQCGFPKLVCLESLDIRYNLLSDLPPFCALISDLVSKNLTELWIEGNELCQSRQEFLARLQCPRPKSLEWLDGSALTLEEKAMATKFEPGAVDGILRHWMHWLVFSKLSRNKLPAGQQQQQQQPQQRRPRTASTTADLIGNCTSLSLANSTLHSLVGLESLTSLTSLDLSHNRLQTLHFLVGGDKSVLGSLPHLCQLNMAHNEIFNVAQSLVYLAQTCHSLTDLTMVYCSGTPETADPSAYVATVFSVLPDTVMFVDGYRNPRFSSLALMPPPPHQQPVPQLHQHPHLQPSARAAVASASAQQLCMRQRFWHRELAMYVFSVPQQLLPVDPALV